MEAIRMAVREFGTRGCASLMAQEFGDHPEAAAERMRWIRQLLGDALGGIGQRPRARLYDQAAAGDRRAA
jgi:hypothetical protein